MDGDGIEEGGVTDAFRVRHMYSILKMSVEQWCRWKSLVQQGVISVAGEPT